MVVSEGDVWTFKLEKESYFIEKIYKRSDGVFLCHLWCIDRQAPGSQTYPAHEIGRSNAWKKGGYATIKYEVIYDVT